MEEKTMTRSHSGSTLSRTVFKTMGLFGGIQVFSILCGLVRTKLVAVWLGTSGVGMFAIFTSALTLVSNLSQLNLRTSAVRTIAAGTSSARLPLILYSIRRLGLWLGIIGVAAMLLSAPVFSLRTFGTFSHTTDFMLLAAAVFVMSLTMSEQAVLQGLGRMRPLAKSNVIGTGAGLLISVPILYFMRSTGILWVIVAYSFAAWLGVRYNVADTTRLQHRPNISEVWHIGSPVLKMGFYLTLASVTTELCSYIFIAYLNTTGGTSEVGLFQSGYTLVHRYMGMIFSAIGMEFFPRLSSVASSLRRTSAYINHEVFLLSLILLGVVALFIPLAPVGVRVLYSEEFVDIVPFVILSMPGVVLQGASWCMAYVLLSRGDGRLYMFTEVLSAIITITLNIAFYHVMNLTGVGLSFSVQYLAYFCIVAAVYRYRYGLRLAPQSLRAIALVLIAITAMSALSLIAGPWVIILSVPAVAISFLYVRRLMR